MLIVAASREKLMPLFRDLIGVLDEDVHVVMENSFEGNHALFVRANIDRPVLESSLIGCEDFLVNDGCSGIIVANDNEDSPPCR